MSEDYYTAGMKGAIQCYTPVGECLIVDCAKCRIDKLEQQNAALEAENEKYRLGMQENCRIRADNAALREYLEKWQAVVAEMKNEVTLYDHNHGNPESALAIINGIADNAFASLPGQALQQQSGKV